MTQLLDTIHSPLDVKTLTVPQLEILAEEIREELISVLSKTGGHLGPNLGVVELTLAMHYVFNTPTDRFVFDVSHSVISKFSFPSSQPTVHLNGILIPPTSR